MSQGYETYLPDWLPIPVRLYLSHTTAGQSLRALARVTGLNASTVMRQVRRYEGRRDDPLMDAALSALAGGAQAGHLPDAQELDAQSFRLLRRLAEPGSVLAFSAEQERAVVMRALPGGRNARTAVIERPIALAFCLKDWLGCRTAGRVSTYEITPHGRAEFRRLLDRARPRGLSESAQSFVGVPAAAAPDRGALYARALPRAGRNVTFCESPVAVLGRRREKDGSFFLAPELVAVAERLREDYELALIGWPAGEKAGVGFWLEATRAGNGQSLRSTDERLARARARVCGALQDLGQGLDEVVLQVCCKLEGVERTEQRMGWAARSGKIVLRIALVRLRRHYEENYGRASPLIG